MMLSKFWPLTDSVSQYSLFYLTAHNLLVVEEGFLERNKY